MNTNDGLLSSYVPIIIANGLIQLAFQIRLAAVIVHVLIDAIACVGSHQGRRR